MNVYFDSQLWRGRLRRIFWRARIFRALFSLLLNYNKAKGAE